MKKGYEDLSKECMEKDRQNEAQALEKLINDNDAHFDEK